MIKSFLLSTVLGMSMASVAASYPVVVNCTNPDNPEHYLSVGMNFLNNTAMLTYHVDEAHHYVVRIGGWSGYNAHSMVSFENYTGGGLTTSQTLTFSGSASQAMRVLHYNNFELKLKVNNENTYAPLKFSYGSGSDAAPEKSFEGSLENMPMICTIQGM